MSAPAATASLWSDRRIAGLRPGGAPAAAPALPAEVAVVVVGSGLAGSSTALALARLGVDVLLLEAAADSSPAEAGAGMLVPAPEGWVHALLQGDEERAARVLAVVGESIRALAAEPSASAAPALHVATSDREHEFGPMLAAALRQEGWPAEILDRSGLRRYVDSPPSALVRGGLLLPSAVAVDPAALLARLQLLARAQGARIAYSARVESLRVGEENVMLTTTAGTVLARQCVVAAGARSAALLPDAMLPVTVASAQMLATVPARPVLGALVTSSLGENGEYLRQLASGEILIGGCRRPEDTLSADDIASVTAPTQEAIEQVLPRLFPDIQLPPVRSRWAGAMSWLPDGLPVVDRVRPGLWLSAGHSDGLAFAPALARSLAEAVAAEDPALLTPDFRLDRFAAVAPAVPSAEEILR